MHPPQRQELADEATRLHTQCCCRGPHTTLVEECTLEDWRLPLPLSNPGGSPKQAVVALGKFDAMHKGHRSLATAAAELGGHPWLLSFSNMAEVLGWPKRSPLVAASDRERVLQSWAPDCGGLTPKQRFVPFGAVRNMSPQEFVRCLAQDLQVSGVVVGNNYRFGYRAAGDTAMLQSLGQRYGLSIAVLDLIGAGVAGRVGQVSSSKVREALAMGRMARAEEYLGRRYRLVAEAPLVALHWPSEDVLLIPRELFQNQLPRSQTYTADVSFGSVASLTEPFGPAARMDVVVGEQAAELHLNNGAAFPNLPAIRIMVDF
ncbi:hypothetical protein WJX72_008391 [[Myrmecia] bisecta]|uniref:FAD synthase n=1 Tax=[Myrmecia] bisecta TaxID=41462 RepID=A0AAW1PAA2_9CHLO